jgi:2-methylcitrate dehydratase PrpD
MARNTQVSADHNAPPITAILAKFVATHPSRGWGDAVEHEALRTLYNWLGCAIGASHHEAPMAALKASQLLEGAPQATVLGRAERLDMASAALVNGISSHTFDFDDTHLKTIIHPAGPVASALLALAEKTGASGRQLIDALVLGIDVACRVGNMMYPDHYDRGWHITGSTGTLGAAAACARLLQLSEQQTLMALGIAASQPIGMREQFGTMTKPFHPGGAARAGLMSALLAQQGFTASAKAIEAPRGMAQTISTKNDWSEITSELGQRFEISFNSYKPFACGIVIHPAIDGCVQLRRAHNLQPQDIAKVELKVHSLVLELTGKKTPQDGLQAKFSVFHSCAAGLINGQAGEDEYADAFVQRADVIALRDRVSAVVDERINEDQVDVTVTLHSAQVLHLFVPQAIGSQHNPLTDAMLEAKFRGLVEPVLGAAAVQALTAQCWALSEAPTLAALCRVAVPGAQLL